MRKPKVPNPLHDRWNQMLLQAKKGDLGVLGDLFTEMSPTLRARLCLLIGDNRDVDPDDILQEGFIAVARALVKFDLARGSAYCWIWKICHNIAVSGLRLKSPKKKVSLNAIGDAAGPDPKQKEPDARLLRLDEMEEARSKLTLALDHLQQQPEPVRRAVTLRLAGLTYEETADVLAVPVGTVATWVRRYRRGLP